MRITVWRLFDFSNILYLVPIQCTGWQGECNALLYDWDSQVCSLATWSGTSAAPHSGLRVAWASSVHPDFTAWSAIDNNLFGSFADRVAALFIK